MHLLVIGGPTATGKTALAAELAHILGTDVISADSRQVYRGLDLGTGKDLYEFRRYQPAVDYHLIDIVEPEVVYSLFQYQEDCFRTIENLSQAGGARGKVAVLAGGTGMYMESVLRRYRIANVPEDIELREALGLREMTDLAEELERMDPDLAARTDMSSKKRIIRALEVARWSLDQAVEYSRLPEGDFTYTTFVTALDRTEQRARIDRRLAERLQAGMIEEVQALLDRGVTPARLKLLGMEYRQIAAFLLGEKTKEQMIEDLRHEIHMLAKRQETYFRGMERRGVPIHWLPEGHGVDAILKTWRATP